jgi:hypothetical protein
MAMNNTLAEKLYVDLLNRHYIHVIKVMHGNHA